MITLIIAGIIVVLWITTVTIVLFRDYSKIVKETKKACADAIGRKGT